MATKPYNNKSQFDPGRFRSVITFSQETTTDDGAGGTVVTVTPVLTTKGIKDVYKHRLSENGQIILEGGITNETKIWYFIIRFRRSFTPTKTMQLTCEGQTYTIRDIEEIDIPVNYIKLLCVLSE